MTNKLRTLQSWDFLFMFPLNIQHSTDVKSDKIRPIHIYFSSLHSHFLPLYLPISTRNSLIWVRIV